MYSGTGPSVVLTHTIQRKSFENLKQILRVCETETVELLDAEYMKYYMAPVLLQM